MISKYVGYATDTEDIFSNWRDVCVCFNVGVLLKRPFIGVS